MRGEKKNPDYMGPFFSLPLFPSSFFLFILLPLEPENDFSTAINYLEENILNFY